MIAERANHVHHRINRQMPRRSKEITSFCCTWCLLLQNTELTMRVDGAATFVLFLRWPVYVSNFCFFPPAAMPWWQGQARLSAPGAMGRITNAKALVTPAPGGPEMLQVGRWGMLYCCIWELKKSWGRMLNFGKVFWWENVEVSSILITQEKDKKWFYHSVTERKCRRCFTAGNTSI